MLPVLLLRLFVTLRQIADLPVLLCYRMSERISSVDRPTYTTGLK